ncbi:FAD-dependent oxidoreductase [Planktothrix sp. FACHB-1355]|uniref:FAD-dependent oxidoreductase n=1 Tax=Aerosakkonema funiforme FACHB-1375 TaxID=2949571 RepID=A0A926VJT4_9CYAN|nr:MULTISPECIES: FAD-dependent oxidoreductase [Oscillatoriales]MBD2185115.1 FAD-dependent oxidoreductase [Aerosakkonema funiforme FACHB-1375]MBD3559888.1 FAD-dependent oxidoreductase [Planktothrix sp. FACHB-1355]
MSTESQTQKVVIVGAGWAGLGATYHLAKQGYDVTLLEAGSYPGGLVAGWKTAAGRSVEAGIHGFWYPYRNIFSLVNELELNPFTTWTRSSQYSPAGLEVESPIFQDEPLLPTPLGTFLYPKFRRLPLIDRLSALPLLYALIDFDNSDAAWQRYDGVTARELFKQFGVSARLYRDSFEPMLLVGLFAPGEQCSAAAALGMLYYFILAHQPNFDVVWCRGTVGEKIFRPWVERIEQAGGKVVTQQRVSDLIIDNNRATGVVCGDRVFDADAVIFAVGITGMQKIVSGSPSLQSRQEFRDAMNLGAIDVLATRLWFDRKIDIPLPSNACFGFNPTTGWTFFDLNALHDEYRNEPGTVIEADFYHANQFLPLRDEEIVQIVQRDLATCIPAFGEAKVIDSSAIRLPRAVTHFYPGSYQYMLPAVTSFDNIFMSGDWIVNRHGSWSQEKAYVTGLEAANLVVDRFKRGNKATILPVEADEPHIQIARTINQWGRDLVKSVLPDFWLP